MPRSETKYFCDMCGQDYLKEEEAIECEQRHLKVEKIHKANYSNKDLKSEYPYSIFIVLSNGMKMPFYREGREPWK